jgi:hypothetical protein
MGTQIPEAFLSYPRGQEGNICPSATFMLKGCVVVNTAVNIVAANTTAIPILFRLITMYL